MLYQSKNGRYRVEVAADGGVRVKPGDWLSKYSAAIYNNYSTINVFYRKNRTGNLERLANPNLIFAGEILYHLPTFMKAREVNFDKGAEIVSLNVPNLTEVEKKKLTIEHLKKEFNLRGEHLAVLSKSIDIIGYTGDAIAVTEVAGLIASTGAAAAVGTVLSVASLFLMPIAGVIALVNVGETGLRHIGMRAIAYATTAWAFADPIPGPPTWLHTEISDAAVQKAIQANPGDKSFERLQAASKAPIAQMRKAWDDAARATVKRLEEEVVKRNVQKTSYQVLLRAIGDNDRQTLAIDVLMKELENSLSAGSERHAFWTPPPHYPGDR